VLVVVVGYVYLVPAANFLVKEFSVLNFEAKCLSGVVFFMINRYLGREGIWCVKDSMLQIPSFTERDH